MTKEDDLIKEAEQLIEDSFKKLPPLSDKSVEGELDDIVYHRNRLVIEDIIKKGDNDGKKAK
jgi:hypothetical protein